MRREKYSIAGGLKTCFVGAHWAKRGENGISVKKNKQTKKRRCDGVDTSLFSLFQTEDEVGA